MIVMIVRIICCILAFLVTFVLTIGLTVFLVYIFDIDMKDELIVKSLGFVCGLVSVGISSGVANLGCFKEKKSHTTPEEIEPEEKATPEKLKTDNPNTNDPSKLYIFSGEKGKIIMVRDGKVIYEEDMKVDPDMYSRNSSYPDHL